MTTPADAIIKAFDEGFKAISTRHQEAIARSGPYYDTPATSVQLYDLAMLLQTIAAALRTLEAGE